MSGNRILSQQYFSQLHFHKKIPLVLLGAHYKSHLKLLEIKLNEIKDADLMIRLWGFIQMTLQGKVLTLFLLQTITLPFGSVNFIVMHSDNVQNPYFTCRCLKVKTLCTAKKFEEEFTKGIYDKS